MYDEATSFRLQELRAKVRANTATTEELRESLILLRNGRLTATNRPDATKKRPADRTAKPKPSVSGMLGELAGL
jgi:hypothetical protein